MAKDSTEILFDDELQLLDTATMSDIMKKRPNRTAEELPEPIEVYEDTVRNPVTGEMQTVMVKVYPPEPSPLEHMKPAFAFGSH